MSRYGAKVDGGTVTAVLVLADGPKGDEALDLLDLVEQDGVRPGIGWSWDGSVFAPPPLPPKTWDDIRAERDHLLVESDWTQMPDSPLNGEQKNAWADYRQELRDLPQSFATPDEVVWPAAP